MRRAAAVVLALVALVAPEGIPAPAAAPDVTEATMCRRVTDRMPEGAGTEFAAGTEVYCWTRLAGFPRGVRIEHVWYRGDREFYRRAVEVGGDPWRAWSRKVVPADSAGPWRVEIVGPGGHVLRTLRFRVR